MAISADYVKLATNSARALADTALDSLRDAVLVIDAYHQHLPVVLANAAARGRLTAESNTVGLIESPLHRWLTPASSSVVEDALAVVSDSRSLPDLALAWRFVDGESSVMTEIKALASAPGQRLVMMTLATGRSDGRVLQVVEGAPFGMLLLDSDLKVTYANEGAQHQASMPVGLAGVSALRLTPTAALHADVFARALKGISYHSDALEVAAPTGALLRFEIDVLPLKSGPVVVGLLVLSTEVTVRRGDAHSSGGDERPVDGGERLQGSSGRSQGSAEPRLLALTEHARDIITVAAKDGTVIYVSGGVRNSLGYTSEERQANNVFEHVHPEDYQGLRAKYQQLVDGQIKNYSREFRIRHKNGSYRWLESSFTSAIDNPLIGGMVINSRDITERKLAEGRLAQREEVFRLAADAVDGVIFEWDMSSGFVHRSRGVLEVLGLNPEDLEPSVDAWRKRVHRHDIDAAKRAINLALLNGRGWTTTYRIRDARGHYRSILERGLIQRNSNGDPVRAIGCCVDVSEIKRVTDVLTESQRAAKIGGWEYNYVTRELTWTDETHRIYETSAGEFTVSWESMLARCTAESLRRFHEACDRSAAEGGQIEIELEITTLKGRRIWVLMIGHLEMSDGQLIRAFGSVQNVHAQKLAQIALEQSTRWLKLSMTMAHMHAWRWDRTRDVFEFAIVDGHRESLPSVFPSMSKMLSRVHPADRQTVRRAIDTAFQYQEEVQKEFRLKTGTGRYRWYAVIARPMVDAADSPCGLVGVIQDVTARRDSEIRLRRSEELLSVVTANTADTLVLIDTAMRVRFINRGVAGMSLQQIIGREIGVLLPPPAREGVLERLQHLLDTGETATYEFEAEMPEGVRYFENRAVLVRDNGIGTGISISTRDITERKRLEQEILDVSGRERQSIGRDLHDGLGQELTGVALMLRALAGRVGQRYPEAVEPVNEIIALVNQSIENARALARGLLPVRTETGGLAAALRELASRSRDLYGLEVNFHAEVSPALNLDETDASHLYRIAQEALTNSARHGRATVVDIILVATEDTFLLRITDNGEGFRAPMPPYTGMGLKIMMYRAGMIGAKFEIASNGPRGTVVRVMGEQPPTASITRSVRVN